MIVECVPNVSEGRDPVIVSRIARAAGETPGVYLLDVTSDADHHRSVVTFAGSPEAVGDAAVDLVAEAIGAINLSRHVGVHPRLGAADVVPFVPVSGVSMAECAELAHRVGRRIWRDLGVPVYFYGEAALRPECVRLEEVRRLAPNGLAPDAGDVPHPTAGVCVVGARKFLVAWNINLRSSDLAFARELAGEVRESSGGYAAVKAIGLPLESRDQVQVSINLVDFEQTPLAIVFEHVAQRCAQRGVEIAGSELIGMIPEAALSGSAGCDLKWENLRPELVLESRLRALGARLNS